MAFEVKVDRAQLAGLKYPSDCIVCGATAPTSRVAVGAGLSDDRESWFGEDIFAWVGASFPTCPSCRWCFKVNRILDAVLSWLACLLAFAITWWSFEHILSAWRKVVVPSNMIGSQLVLGFLKDKAFVAIVTCLRSTDEVSFYFRDSHYAGEFARINGLAADNAIA